MLVLLILLIVVPVTAWLWARRRQPSRVWLVTGFAFGAIVSPFSRGLYSTYFFGPIGAFPGWLGLSLNLFHGVPGFEIATFLGLLDPRHVGEGVEDLYVEGLNGLVWGVAYGFVGWCIDRLRLLGQSRVAP